MSIYIYICEFERHKQICLYIKIFEQTSNQNDI